MKLTLLKKDGRKEVINRVELDDLAAAIKDGRMVQAVRKMREVYHLMNPHRLADADRCLRNGKVVSACHASVLRLTIRIGRANGG